MNTLRHEKYTVSKF